MRSSIPLDRGSTRVGLAAWLETLTGGLLLVPLAMIAVAVAGFVLGLRMGPWVLVLAAVSSAFGLRALSASWRTAGLMGAAIALAHVAAGLVAALVPDGSWDGLAYQQEAILRLAAGWNPLFEDASAYGWGNDLYLNHYPKASWISGAAVMLGTGHVEAGKLFNLTFMLAAAAQVTSVLLRLTPLHLPAAAGLALLAALNPVAISQVTSFYVDGALASLLTVIVASLVWYVPSRQRRTLVVALLAACLAINLKFPGLAYVVVLLALSLLILWRWHGFRAASRFAAAAAAAGAVGVLLLGHDPYVQNFRDKGHPLYPAAGVESVLLDFAVMRPVNLTDRNRVTRFLISNFSRTEIVRPPAATHLKFPFSVGRGELRGVYYPGTEAGGFGPFYGGMLLVAGVGALALMAHRSTRLSGSLVLLVGACLTASVFVHEETWWARYVPQAWLLPLLVAAPSLCSPRRSFQWWVGCGLVGLASVSVFVVGINIAYRQFVYVRETRIAIQQILAAPEPVTVYLGGFRSLRQRLLEAGVDFRMVEMPPDPARRRHPIPSPGNQAFWVE